MFKSGWKLLPAAFFLLLNFAASEVKHQFFLRLAYFGFLLAVFFLCRHFRLDRILSLLSGGIALVLFTHGLLQKFVLFPMILERQGAAPSFYAQAMRTRVASGRVFGIFPLPTLYAMVCGLLLICIIHYLLHARGGARIFWSLLLVLGAGNLVLTQSFGGILFFTGGILFYLFASRIFKLKYLAPLLMILALVLFLVIALRFSEARELTPAKLRFANWMQAGRLVAASPLLGVGLGNYETSVPAQVLPGEPESIYAHNFFLQMAAETGLPLFFLLLVICWSFFKNNLVNLLRPENALFAAACILLLFFNFFDVGVYFFAAGISFTLAFSQVVAAEGPARPRHFVVVVLLAAALLLSEIGNNRQKSGDLWLSRQDLARAEVAYRGALKLDPFAYRAWLGLAHIAWQRQDLAQAELAGREVLRIYPRQPYANYLLSLAAWRRGAFLTALFHARQAAIASKRNREYLRWHEHIQGSFTQ